MHLNSNQIRYSEAIPMIASTCIPCAILCIQLKIIYTGGNHAVKVSLQVYMYSFS